METPENYVDSQDDGEEYIPDPSLETSIDVEGPPERRRGRPRGRPRNEHNKNEPNPPGRLKTKEELQRIIDFDEWANAFDWTVPRTKMTLYRKAPRFAPGTTNVITGFLDEREAAPFTLTEIKQRWGGGTFEAVIFGLPHENAPHAVAINRRQFEIGGPPVVGAESLPRSARDLPPDQVRRILGGSGDKAMDIVSDEVAALRRQLDERGKHDLAATKLIKDSFTETTALSMRAMQAQAQAQVDAAQRLVDEYKARMERAEAERDTVTQRQREVEEAVSEKLRASESSSLQLLANLVPSFSNSAKEQVQMVIMQYAAREERAAAEHQNAINNLHEVHRSQLKALENQSEARIKHLEIVAANTENLYKMQIQSMQAEKEALLRRVEDLQRENTKLSEKVLELVTTQKGKGALEQLEEVAKLKETMEILGLGGSKGDGGDADIGDGIESPMGRSLVKLADKLMPHVPAIVAGLSKQPTGTAPGYPPPGRSPALPTAPSTPPQPLMAPATTPTPPTTPPVKKLSKADVEPALRFFGAVLSQANPPTVEDVAITTVSKIDNSVLRELCKRKPEDVVARLESTGMLEGVLAEERGKKFLVDLLVAVKARVGG